MPQDTTKNKILNKALLRFGSNLYETDFSNVRPYHNAPTVDMYQTANYLKTLLPNINKMNFNPISGSTQFTGIYDIPQPIIDRINMAGGTLSQNEINLLQNLFPK